MRAATRERMITITALVRKIWGGLAKAAIDLIIALYQGMAFSRAVTRL
jgi:hypothetical protein